VIDGYVDPNDRDSVDEAERVVSNYSTLFIG
jgi:hypothetical protein